jgi:uncharacterized membrane protein YeaQ/YmgE (transglycosylase-associated protein family)
MSGESLLIILLIGLIAGWRTNIKQNTTNKGFFRGRRLG